jgi:hypothetical protein
MAAVNDHIQLLALTGSKNPDGVFAELTDEFNNIYGCSGSIAAPSGTAGYAVGCIYRRTDTGTVYVNKGTASACAFVPFGNPSHNIKYAGIANYGGGAASFNISVPGVLTTDVVLVTLAASTNVVYLVKAASAADNIAVTLSGDPGAATKINYSVLRVAA